VNNILQKFIFCKIFSTDAPEKYSRASIYTKKMKVSNVRIVGGTRGQKSGVTKLAIVRKPRTARTYKSRSGYNPGGWKSAVMKLINSKLETKFVTGGGLINVPFNSGISGPSEFYSIIPPIVRGPGSWQLLDNQLSPLRINTKFTICLSNVSRTQNLMVNLFIFKHKKFNAFPNLLTGSDARILKTGQSTETQNYNGFISDAQLPINTNTFTLLKKYSFKLISNVGLSNGDTTNGNAPNMDRHSVKQISYTYKRKAILKYKADQTASPIYPENDAPFWCIGYSKTDGSAPDALQQNITVTTQCSMTYKDA